MKQTQDYDFDVEPHAEQLDFYMPGTPRLSTGEGRIERFVKSLVRRRGKLRPAWKRG